MTFPRTVKRMHDTQKLSTWNGVSFFVIIDNMALCFGFAAKIVLRARKFWLLLSSAYTAPG